jgi:fibronectin type 3 domain-containing protein
MRAFGVPVVCAALLVAAFPAYANTTTSGHSKHRTAHHWIHLTWKPGLGGTAVVGYNIYRSNPGHKQHFQKLNGSPVHKAEYDDRKVKSGRTYLYLVKAVDAKGKQSDASNEITLKVP